MYLKRKIQLPEDYSFFLFGPRQVGKTTLIKQRFSLETTLVFNLLNYDLVKSLTRDPSLFRQEINSRDPKFTHVVVDEIQKLPWLLDEVHSIIENSKNPPVFILTGSSARKLKKEGANMLAGRAIEKHLYPLTHMELDAEARFSLQKVLELGSLPLVFHNEAETVKEILKTYANTYIKEEIKEEALVRNLDAFSDFLLLSSSENGQLLNYNSISQNVGVSSNTIKEYYQILEDTLMGFRLLPLKKAVRQRIVKSPKFYFFDTGVARSLSGKLSLPLLRGTEEFGNVFEAWMINEIRRVVEYAKLDCRFSFYRTSHDAEVDLILELPTRMLAIEIKASDNPKPKELSGLRSFAENFPEAELYCVCLAEHPRDLGGVRVLPWRQIFEFLDFL